MLIRVQRVQSRTACASQPSNRILTFSSLIPLRFHSLPYRSKPPLLISDIRALWRSALSVRAPNVKNVRNSGLAQYGTEPFEQQQFGTAGVEGVKYKAQQ